MSRFFKRPFRQFRKRRMFRRRRNLAKTDFGSQTAGQNNVLSKVNRTLASGLSVGQKIVGIGRALASVASLVNVEKKALDNNVNVTPIPVPATGNMPNFVLNAMAQGTSENTRIGNSVLSKSLQCRLILNNQDTSAHVVRVIIVRDMQMAGTVGTLGTVLEDPSTMISPLNIINGNAESRYSVIMDKTHVLVPGTNQIENITYYTKLFFHSKYIDTDTSAGSLGQNAIYGWVFTDTADTVSGSFYWRYRFIDN